MLQAVSSYRPVLRLVSAKPKFGDYGDPPPPPDDVPQAVSQMAQAAGVPNATNVYDIEAQMNYDIQALDRLAQSFGYSSWQDFKNNNT